MRYAIVSDLHANWQAWCAVRDDLLQQGVDAVVCLGDVVGYGPNPKQVLKDLRQYCDNFVLGNHDAAVVGKLDLEIFNDTARRSVEWTRAQLDKTLLDEIQQWPLLLEDEQIVFVHAETVAPDAFGYVEQAEDVRVCFEATDKRFIFLGHTHRPVISVLPLGGKVILSPLTRLTFADGARYLVNAGSVGDPRDGTDKASYCLCDTTADRVELRQVAFDTAAFLRELKRHPQLDIPWFLRKRGGAKVRLELDHAIKAEEVTKIQRRETVNRSHLKAVHYTLPTTPVPVTTAGETEEAEPSAAPAAEVVSPESGSRFAQKRWIVLFALILALAGVVAVTAYYLKKRRIRISVSLGWPKTKPTPLPVSPPSPPPAPVIVDKRAPFELLAKDARLTGSPIKLEAWEGIPNIGYWDCADNYATWTTTVPGEGEYVVTLEYGFDPAGGDREIVILCGESRLEATLKTTGHWKRFQTVTLGHMYLPAGTVTITVRAGRTNAHHFINLRQLTFTPFKGESKPLVRPPPRTQTLPWLASASYCAPNDTMSAMNDNIEPSNSNDQRVPRFTWWPHFGTKEWVQADFMKPFSISKVSVYWYAETGRGKCRVPQSWRLLYRKEDGQWAPVEGASGYGTSLDTYNTVTFRPVTTTGLRLEAQLQPNYSAGILELKIEP